MICILLQQMLSNLQLPQLLAMKQEGFDLSLDFDFCLNYRVPAALLFKSLTHSTTYYQCFYFSFFLILSLQLVSSLK